jgi:hypothetical protein
MNKLELSKPFLFTGKGYLISFENCSVMINNDERFYIADSLEEVESRMKTLERVYFVRPIHQSENLPTEKEFSLSDVKCKYFTSLNSLHSLYIKYNIQNYLRSKTTVNQNKTVWESIISNTIGDEYCDCMSGGMSIDTIKIIRKIVKDSNMNLDMECYVDYPLRKFMKETERYGETELLLEYPQLCLTS